jgi:hypothetical protein
VRKIRVALNHDLKVAAVTADSTIAPKTVSFTRYTDGAHLYVTSVSSGSIQTGGPVSGLGLRPGGQNIYQLTLTLSGVGEYSLFSNFGTVSTPESVRESYGVLTVGALNSGTVAIGQEITGAEILPLTAIDGNLSGSGPEAPGLSTTPKRSRATSR